MLVKINIENDSNALEAVDNTYFFKSPAEDTNGVEWVVYFEETELGEKLDEIYDIITEDRELNNEESINKMLDERDVEEFKGCFKGWQDIQEYIINQFETSGSENTYVDVLTPVKVFPCGYNSDEINCKIVGFDEFEYIVTVEIDDEDYSDLV